MPISSILRKLLCCAPGRQTEEETEAPVGRPEPVEAGPVQAERPYRGFVEGEAERFRQVIEQAGSLDEPVRQEHRSPARAAAGGNRNLTEREAYMAVIAMQMHLAKWGGLSRWYTPVQASPNFIEALIQLADDAGWLYREIPLPFHRAPHHPPIHYTVDPRTEQPVPTDDSFIRGDYVHNLHDGSRLTSDRFMRPWRNPYAHPSLNDLTTRGWRSCYALSTDCVSSRNRRWDPSSDSIRLRYFWIITLDHGLMLCERTDRESFWSHP